MGPGSRKGGGGWGWYCCKPLSILENYHTVEKGSIISWWQLWLLTDVDLYTVIPDEETTFYERPLALKSHSQKRPPASRDHFCLVPFVFVLSRFHCTMVLHAWKFCHLFFYDTQNVSRSHLIFRCRKWVPNTRCQDLLDKTTAELHTGGYYICSEYFEPSQFTIPEERKCLN